MFALAASLLGWRGKVSGIGDTLPVRFLPVSLLTEGNLDLDEFPELVRDGVPYYLVSVDGHLYSKFPVGGALLVTPFFAVAQALGFEVFHDRAARDALASGLAAGLAALAVAVCFATYAPRGLGRAALVAVALGFGTGVWPMCAQDLWQHTFGVSLAALCLLCLERGEEDPRWLGWMGVPAALLGVVRPMNAVVVAVLAAWVLWRRPKVFVRFAIPVAIAAGAMLGYNLFRFAHPFGAYAEEAGRLSPRETLPMSLIGLLVSPARGLFVYSPVLLGGAFAFSRGVEPERLPLRRLLAIAIAAHVLLFSTYLLWWGGWCFGPRHLLEVMPFAAALLGYGLPLLARRRIDRIALAGTLVWSIAANGAGRHLGWEQWSAHPDVDWLAHRRLWDLRDNPLASYVLGLPPSNPYRAPGRPAQAFTVDRSPIDFTRDGDWTYLIRGWTRRPTPREPIGMGRRLGLVLRFPPERPPGRVTLVVRAVEGLPGPQRVRVRVNKRPAAEAELTTGAATRLELAISDEEAAAGPVRIALELATWRRRGWREIPAALATGTALDIRPDSMILERIEIERFEHRMTIPDPDHAPS